jgi:hypothetical protein
VSDLLQSGAAWLAGKIKARAAQTVTYRRGADSVSLSATLGHSLLRVTEGDGRTRTIRTDRDFLVTAADLVLSGETVTPARGDAIDLTVGSTAYRYKVLPYGKDEPLWRYSEPSNAIMRIHCKSDGVAEE